MTDTPSDVPARSLGRLHGQGVIGFRFPWEVVVQPRRVRIVRAAVVGIVVAGLAVASQILIGVPVGDQPEWLAYIPLILATPSAYLLFPIQDPLESLIKMRLGSGVTLEGTTPFGPAFLPGVEDLALTAFGTIVVVGLIGYLAMGVQEMTTPDS